MPDEGLGHSEIQALAWVDRLTSGEATQQDLAAFERWSGESAANRQAVADALRMRKLIQSPALDTGVSAGPQAIARSRGINRRVALFGGAGVLAGSYVAAQSPLGLWPTLQEMNADYRTGAGGRERIAAVTGVTIELNTRTSLNLEGRRATLVEGEAHVAVAGGSDMFEVLAGTGRVASGSATFSVRNMGGQAQVTCSRGSVAVSHHRGKACRLGPSESVAYGPDGLGRPERIDLEAALAWRTGRLVFRDASLADVVHELNRYAPQRIVLVRSGAEDRRFNGVFQTARIADAIQQVAKVAGRRPIEAGGVILLV